MGEAPERCARCGDTGEIVLAKIGTVVIAIDCPRCLKRQIQDGNMPEREHL